MKLKTMPWMWGLVTTGVLSVIAWKLAEWVYGMKLPLGIPGKALEYPLWAALVGLAGNLILKRLGMYERVKPGIKTELFLKTGLVLLGAGINLSLLVKTASGALVQALILVPSVFFFCWWLGGKLNLEDKLRAVMAAAVSICGVSAAIAAAGAVLAKKEHVTYITALVIVVALPLMVILPLVAGALHLPESIAGAWFAGNIDTTAAVVGAGTIYGEQAQKVASIVKSAQNALIGVAAFLLALAFAVREGRAEQQRPSPRVIWERFPKFVLGFIGASVLYTLGVIDGGKGTPIDTLKNWAFTFAFVGMGLELSAVEFRALGWRPVTTFLITTVFNLFLALGTAWVIFGMLLPIK